MDDGVSGEGLVGWHLGNEELRYGYWQLMVGFHDG